jgi:hypothetical protein
MSTHERVNVCMGVEAVLMPTHERASVCMGVDAVLMSTHERASERASVCMGEDDVPPLVLKRAHPFTHAESSHYAQRALVSQSVIPEV